MLSYLKYNETHDISHSNLVERLSNEIQSILLSSHSVKRPLSLYACWWGQIGCESSGWVWTCPNVLTMVNQETLERKHIELTLKTHSEMNSAPTDFD